MRSIRMISARWCARALFLINCSFAFPPSTLRDRCARGGKITLTPPKPIPKRALLLAGDPTKAWEITQATQGVPSQLFGFSAATPKPAGTVRFVFISDTHSCEGNKEMPSIPDGDVLVHCGDFTNVGKIKEVEAFARWFGTLPHARKVLIAGNHDLSLDPASFATTAPRFMGRKLQWAARHRPEAAAASAEQTYTRARALLEAIPRCDYLCDSGTSIEGISVWGSPWQPEFCEWAFNLPRGQPCRDKWRLIPPDTDVLLTHGPPLGHGDLCSESGQRAGCIDLLDEVQARIRPAVHAFGHIHEGAGVTTDGATLFLNACTCNLRYSPVNPAIVVDILPPDPANGEGCHAQEPGG